MVKWPVPASWDKWQQRVWALALGACALAVPLSTTGAWLLLAPATILLAYFAGRRLASLAHGLLALSLGTTAAALILLSSAQLSVLGFFLNLLAALVLFVVLPWLLGRARRNAVLFRQQEREHLVVQAELRERNRIAGQMHDRLGHELALLALQASALQVSVDKDSPAGEQAGRIREQADAAIDSLHHIIGVLRSPCEASALAPGQGTFSGLVAASRARGMDIRLTGGEHLPPGEAGSWWGSALYQVAQEALTNAAKYAPGAPVEMAIAASKSSVELKVSTPLPGRAVAARPGALGLAGLRALLESGGGCLRAGKENGSFTVVARIPKLQQAPARSGPISRPRRAPRRWLAIAVPALVVVAFGVGLYLVQEATFRATGLSPSSYRELSVGMDRAEVNRIVTAKGLDEPVPVIRPTPPVAGSTCRFYAARNGPLDLNSQMFRLCFIDDTLVSLDHFHPTP